MQAMHEKQPPSLQKFLSECTPGFANGEGTVDAESLVLAVYAGGSIEYFDILDSWLTKDFDKDMSVATAETLEHSR